jgi:Fic family protein
MARVEGQIKPTINHITLARSTYTIKKLTDIHFDAYAATLDVDVNGVFEKVSQREWTSESFRFYTAVSVMSSSRIEGETMEIDSYVKHKLQDIEYLPNLTEKPNDLFAAYEFARDNELRLKHFLEAHRIATQHLLPESQRGVVRSGNMIIMDQQTHRVQYEAAPGSIVKSEFEHFWEELESLLQQNLSTQHVFYYASLIHLVFTKIHPFNDGNGRSARLLEKWFLASCLGDKAWSIGSEHYYYTNLASYYGNHTRVGLFYDQLTYEQAIPFLRMLPSAMSNK